MSTRASSLLFLIVAASFELPNNVMAEDYPTRPIRIVTSAPGASVDLVARVIAQELVSRLGWSVVVDNRGGGVLPAIYVSKTAADGYTLVLGTGVLWTGPFLQQVDYDPAKDFSPITLVGNWPMVLAVHPSLPVKSVKELIILAKSKPGALNYGYGGVGGSNQLAAELFKAMTGLNIAGIPYKGTGPALEALIGGETQLLFADSGGIVPHIKSGRVKALAVSSAAPSELVPGLPTIASSGLPGYELSAIAGIHAPAKTPVSIINRLNQEIVRVLDNQTVKAKCLSAGIEARSSSPEQFASIIKTDMVKMGKVIKDAAIKGD